MADDVLQALANTDLFAPLDETSLQTVADRGITRTYKRGQVLFHAGDPSDSLYVLISGSVRLYVSSEDGQELALGRVESPDVLGVIGATDGGPRSASAEVVDELKVLSLTRSDLVALLGSVPQLIDSYLHALGRLLRRLQDRTEDLVFLDLHGRIAKQLLRFAEESPDGEIDLKVSQAELGAMLHGSRQSVNQVLKTFESRGYIALDGKRISLANRSALERLSR